MSEPEIKHPLVGMSFSNLVDTGTVVDTFWDERLGTMLITQNETTIGYQYKVYKIDQLTGSSVRWHKPEAK